MPSLSNNDRVAVLNEQLRKVQKMMLEDTFVADGTVRRAVTLFSKFLLGKRTHTTIDINREFMTPTMQEQAVADTFKKQEIDDLRTYIDRINRTVKLREKLEGAVIQSQIGGRSALLVEEEQGVPSDLKLLNWGKLGRVFADKDTWELLAVEYADRPKDQPLAADEILYFTWQDYHVSPDSLYHGTSAVLPVVDISETLRIFNSEDLKEAAKVMSADAGFVKFPPNTSRTAMEQFTKEFTGGRWHATSSDVEIQTFDLRPKLEEIMTVIREGRLMIAEDLGIPQFLISSERVPNRAVADLTMNAWRESDLNHARTWLQGIIEPQWYDSLMLLRYPDIDLQKFWLKAKLEFEDITFESLKDKSDAIIPLYQAGLITIEKALKILDMEDVLEQIQAQQRLLQEQRKEELEMMRLEQQKQREEQQDQERSRGGGNGFRGNNEDDEEEEDEEEEVTTRRTRQASTIPPLNMVTKEDIEKQKTEILERLAKAAERPPIIQQQQQQPTELELKLQERKANLDEEERKLRMRTWQETQEVLSKAKARLEVLEKNGNGHS